MAIILHSGAVIRVLCGQEALIRLGGHLGLCPVTVIED